MPLFLWLLEQFINWTMGLFGRLRLPYLTPEQIAAAKAIAEQKKKAGEAAALKYNQDPAAKGDAYGLFRMGECYRDGDGVNKDPSKAKEYFEKAAAAGNPEAATALKKLLPSNR